MREEICEYYDARFLSVWHCVLMLGVYRIESKGFCGFESGEIEQAGSAIARCMIVRLGFCDSLGY